MTPAQGFEAQRGKKHAKQTPLEGSDKLEDDERGRRLITELHSIYVHIYTVYIHRQTAFTCGHHSAICS